MESKYRLLSLSELLFNIEKKRKFAVDSELIDDLVGGVVSGHLHAILGESGSGKTWFCLKVVKSILKINSLAKIGYFDFSANLRSNNLNLMLPEKKYHDQINIYQPKNLIESMVFTKSLLEETKYNLLVFDTIFGSPLQIMDAKKKMGGKWKYNIFTFILSLRRIAKRNELPILITHSLNTDKNHSLYDNDFSIVEPFISMKIILHRFKRERLMDIYFLQQFLGTEKIKLYSS